MSDQGKRSRHGYMYTPFGGEQALKSALGENMARVASGKSAMGLIAPSHKMADELEKTRQSMLSGYAKTLQTHRAGFQNLRAENRQADSALLQRIRQSVDSGGSAQQTLQARHQALQEHKQALHDNRPMLMAHKRISEVTAQQHTALSQTRIVNTSPGIYPDLHPDPPLSFLKPDTQYSKGDKLYVLGHGTPGKDTLYARSDSLGGSLSSTQLAAHLKTAGLGASIMDVRLTACQGVPLLDETDSQVRTEKTKDSNYLVPSFARAMHTQGFRDLTVTGYMGDGVTFPLYAKHHQRSDPQDSESRARRSKLAVRYPVKDMGD